MTSALRCNGHCGSDTPTSYAGPCTIIMGSHSSPGEEAGSKHNGHNMAATGCAGTVLTCGGAASFRSSVLEHLESGRHLLSVLGRKHS